MGLVVSQRVQRVHKKEYSADGAGKTSSDRNKEQNKEDQKENTY